MAKKTFKEEMLAPWTFQNTRAVMLGLNAGCCIAGAIQGFVWAVAIFAAAFGWLLARYVEEARRGGEGSDRD